MVNGLGFNGSYYNPEYQKNLENVVKYVGGTQILPEASGPMDGMGLMLGITAITTGAQGIGWVNNAFRKEFTKEGLTAEQLKAARKASSPFANGGWRTTQGYKDAWTNIVENWKSSRAAIKAEGQAFKDAGGVFSRAAYSTPMYGYRAKTILDCISDKKLEKLGKAGTDNATKALDKYQEAQRLANIAKNGGDGAKDALKEANKCLAEARALAHGAIEPTKWYGKTARFISKYTGYSKASGWIKNLAKDSPTMAKVLKFGKGNGLFFVFSAAIAGVTQVIPTFVNLGFVAGMKQIFKSGAKTLASVGGWAAGSAAGGAAGAAMGAALGTLIPIPGVGTILGSLVGLAAGSAGSWLAEKITGKAVGKDEMDIAKEKEATQVAQEAQNSPQEVQQLIAAAVQKAQQEGTENPDTQIALQSLEKIQQQQQPQFSQIA